MMSVDKELETQVFRKGAEDSCPETLLDPDLYGVKLTLQLEVSVCR